MPKLKEANLKVGDQIKFVDIVYPDPYLTVLEGDAIGFLMEGVKYGIGFWTYSHFGDYEVTLVKPEKPKFNVGDKIQWRHNKDYPWSKYIYTVSEDGCAYRYNEKGFVTSWLTLDDLEEAEYQIAQPTEEEKPIHPDEALRCIKEFCEDNGFSLSYLALKTQDGNTFILNK